MTTLKTLHDSNSIGIGSSQMDRIIALCQGADIYPRERLWNKWNKPNSKVTQYECLILQTLLRKEILHNMGDELFLQLLKNFDKFLTSAIKDGGFTIN